MIMRNFLLFVIFAASVILVKAYLNTSKLKEAKSLKSLYMDSLKESGKSFEEYIPRAKKLFKDARLDKTMIPVMEPVGFGKVVSMNAQLTENLNIKRVNIVANTIPLFDEMIGVFKMRLRESFSVRYWIETILFLPQKAISYIGFEENILSRVVQIVYWILVPLLIAFRSNVYEYISKLFSQI